MQTIVYDDGSQITFGEDSSVISFTEAPTGNSYSATVYSPADSSKVETSVANAITSLVNRFLAPPSRVTTQAAAASPSSMSSSSLLGLAALVAGGVLVFKLIKRKR